jgi:hypothetical protein
MVSGKHNTVTNLADRLIDQGERPFAMSAFIGLSPCQFSPCVLQQVERGVHVRLLTQGITDAHACGDDRSEQQLLARYEPKHSVLRNM